MEEEKGWNIERDAEFRLHYHLISTESHGLTYLGGLGNVISDWRSTSHLLINPVEGDIC